MASKLMANAAFEARLLLRPSHQRTLWTVNKLKCPIPGRPTLPPILSSRSYSDSTSTLTPPLPKPSGSTSTPPLPNPSGSASTPPLPKPSGSTSTPPFPKSSGSTSAPPFPESSGSTSTPSFPESSGSTSAPPFPESSGSTEGSQSSGPKGKNWFSRALESKIISGVLTTAIGSIGAYFIWCRYTAYRRGVRESAIYDKLKKGPEFEEAIKHPIPRKPLVEEIKQLITPTEETGHYPLIVGEHGTGKTSLIKLAVNDMDKNKPKGVVYVNVPDRCSLEGSVVEAMQEALGWSPDQAIDSDKPASIEDVLRVLSYHAIKYKHEYGKIPVLIIDNANKLALKLQELLDLFQDYAKRAADEGIVTVVFVSSEGRVPRHMMERASWSRGGQIIEINDVSKEEALQYLELRKIDKEQTAQIYELVGSRMVHLKYIADQIKNKNKTLEAVRKMIFSSIAEQLESAEMLPELRYHKEAALILCQLLKKESISRDTFYKLVGVSTARKLLETNIFAYDFNSREITFQSTAMKRYCEENSTRWESGLGTAGRLRTRTWLNW